MKLSESKERVIQELKGYVCKQKRAALLRYELSHRPSVSELEVMEGMALSCGGSGMISTGRISNRTMRIALQYRETTDHINGDVVLEISQEIYALETEMEKVDLYVNMLGEEKALLMRACYMSEHPKKLIDLSREMGLSERTLFRYQAEALAELADMFDFVETVSGAIGEEEK